MSSAKSRARSGGSDRTSKGAASTRSTRSPTSSGPAGIGAEIGQSLADGQQTLIRPRRRVREDGANEPWRARTSATAQRSATTSTVPDTRTVNGMLWSGGVVAVRSMNCCDGDSGTRSGTAVAAIPGPRTMPDPEASRSSIRSASPDTVGVSNSSRTPTVVSSSAFSVATTLVADSESPPRSKNESPAATEGTPSSRPNTAATVRSVIVSGSRRGAVVVPKAGAGSAPRSSFFVGVRGTASSTVIDPGTM